MRNETFLTLKNLKARDIILILLTFCSVFLLFSFPRTGQDPSFHNFVDQREILGVPNFYNVITNLPFVIIGLIGLLFSLQEKGGSTRSLAHFILFFGVIGI